jgi:hypothetical protein
MSRSFGVSRATGKRRFEDFAAWRRDEGFGAFFERFAPCFDSCFADFPCFGTLAILREAREFVRPIFFADFAVTPFRAAAFRDDGFARATAREVFLATERFADGFDAVDRRDSFFDVRRATTR